MKREIPNLVTLVNVLAGVCAAVSLFGGHGYWVLIFLGIAATADFLDGLLARYLQVSSPVGKELDSLADMISFGMMPGLIAYHLLLQAWPGPEDPVRWVALPGFLLTAFAALRLAKFNLDDRQTHDFIGLPTPSATLFFAGLYFIYLENSFGLRDLLLEPWLLYILTGLFSGLMVSELPMFSFKFKSGSWKGNEIRYIFMGIALLLLLFLREAAFSALIAVYVLTALVKQMVKKTGSNK